MYSIITNSGAGYGWFLTPNSSASNSAWRIYSTGYANYNGSVSSAHSAIPTLFLKSTETIVEGTTGSEDNPFKLNP